ncbi:MAG: F0F1 ATP synthase subunit alpha [Pseudomonadota bacterium]
MILEGARRAARVLSEVARATRFGVARQEMGRVLGVGDGIASVSGLSDASLGELLEFLQGRGGRTLGYAFNLDASEVGCILLGSEEAVRAGDRVLPTGRGVMVPVGFTLLGRVVNALGEPIDGGPPLRAEAFRPVEREAPAIVERQPVRRPLETAIKVIDVAIPIGRGQRELILGDRRLGKTTIAVDTILNQRDRNMPCFYVSIGQKNAATAKIIDLLRRRGALKYTCVVVGAADDPPGLQFLAPYAGCAMAEYLMEQGQDTLIVYDDLSKHADTYRALSLLLRRPPGREAYPGDIFYVHSRLLERSAKLAEALGGGSQTALPIVETQAQNLAAYIPTNLISITDGQIYLSPELFNQGQRPAVDVGRSVSRIGGATQVAAMRGLGGLVRLEYSQFKELETFSKFGARVEKTTRERIERGRRLSEALKQPPHEAWPVEEQVVLFLALHEGLLNAVPEAEVGAFAERLRLHAREHLAPLLRAIAADRELAPAEVEDLRRETAGLVSEFFLLARRAGA